MEEEEDDDDDDKDDGEGGMDGIETNGVETAGLQWRRIG